jgi:hypothetical protein
VRVLGHLSPLYSGTLAPNVGTPSRLATLRLATAAEVKLVLLYVLTRLRVERDLAYRYPTLKTRAWTLQASVVRIYSVVVIVSRWVR